MLTDNETRQKTLEIFGVSVVGARAVKLFNIRNKNILFLLVVSL